MTLIANITAQRLVVGINALTALGNMLVTQGDSFPLSLVLAQETGVSTEPLEVIALPAPYTRIAIAARTQGNLVEDELLFSATEFVETGAGDDLRYVADLDLNTEPINDKFPDEDLTTRGVPALLDIELTDEAGEERLTIVSQWPVTIRRGIYRGTEGVPVSGDPAYPAPGAIALKAPAGGSYRILNGILELWNTTQGKYQPVALQGAAGEETFVVLEDQP